MAWLKCARHIFVRGYRKQSSQFGEMVNVSAEQFDTLMDAVKGVALSQNEQADAVEKLAAVQRELSDQVTACVFLTWD